MTTFYRSMLQTDKGVHIGHIFTAGDRNVTGGGLRPMNLEQVEDVGEHPQDVVETLVNM
ncbi:MAG: hypothetical protein ACRDWF_01965 [Acidimicrobiia bacterium]